MKLISLIIPTYNRPCQLELLLRSISKNWEIDTLDINVIFKADDIDYLKGYCWVEAAYPFVKFQLEENFSEQMKKLIKRGQNVIGFMVDDCVMFRSPLVTVEALEQCVSLWDDVYVGFSLRLGENTIVQNYLTGELQPSLKGNVVGNNIIEWNWKRYPRTSNYGYWFSWDAHFYSKDLLMSERVYSKYFGIDRSLEHQLITDNNLYRELPNKMLACNASSVFVNTSNTVQTDGAIPAGVKYGYSTKQLNDKFLAGERISLDSFAHQCIISCHEEFPLIWEENPCYKDLI